MADQLANVHPGEVLLEEFLVPLGLSQNALAQALAVLPRRVHEVVLGRRALTADTTPRLARELELADWVLNGTSGVVIEVEGPLRSLATFGRRLLEETPPAAVVQSAVASRLAPTGERDFRIVSSSAAESKSAVVLPDLATLRSSIGGERIVDLLTGEQLPRIY